MAADDYDEIEDENDELCSVCGAGFDEEHDLDCPYYGDDEEDGDDSDDD